MPNYHFVPECYADTGLVKQLFNNPETLNHADGIHRVSRILREEDKPGYVNIGFVDTDKHNVPTYFDEFETIDTTVNVIFKKHPNSRDYLIMVRPAIEKFILKQLDYLNKTPSDFNFPNDKKLFYRTLKKTQIANNNNYRIMIDFIIQNATPDILFIRNMVASII